MKAVKRYTLISISVLQVIILITLTALEYLSGYKAGVMQHLYIQKIRLYNQIYDGLFPIHAVALVLCVGLTLIVTKKSKSHSSYLADGTITICSALLWGFIAMGSRCPEAWPPHSHFLLFFELVCFSQLVRIALKTYWR